MVAGPHVFQLFCQASGSQRTMLADPPHPPFHPSFSLIVAGTSYSVKYLVLRFVKTVLKQADPP